MDKRKVTSGNLNINPAYTYANGKPFCAYIEKHTRRDGSTYEHGTSMDFDLRISSETVSWKRSWECPNGAYGGFSLNHPSPRHHWLTLKAYESYASEKGRTVSRDVLLTLRIEEAEALHEYLSRVIENQKTYSTEEAA